LSQITFGIKISGLAYHPQKKLNESCYKWKLDKKGKFVSYIGVSLMAGYNFNEYVGMKVVQVFMPFDCAGKFSSLSHVGINLTDRIVGWKNEKHRGSASIGPMFYLRKGWLKMKDYEPEKGFMKASESKKWERKFSWYGGQVQYDYYFKENQAHSLNLFPGHPFLYTFGVGETFRID
jgi:hypothetical protein